MIKVKRNRKKPFKKKRPIIQKIILDNWVRIPFPFELEREIQDAFTIMNPEYLNLVKRRRLKKEDWPSGHIITKEKINGVWKSRRIPQWLYYWKYEKELLVPRGAFQVVKSIFNRHGRPYKVINNRVLLEPTHFDFKGELQKKKGQLPFKDWNFKNGILKSGTGTGKTVMACYQTAKIGQSTLVVVDTKELMNQWQNRIKTFLGVDCGIIGDGKKNVKPITVGIVNTLEKNPDLVKHFGFLVVDECHVAAIERYIRVVSSYYGHYVLSLSATPGRKDGKTKVMKWFLGDILMELKRSKAEVLPAKGIFYNTPYLNEDLDFRKKYSVALRTMLENEERNKVIIDNLVKNIDFFGIHLVISNSSKHLERLFEMLPHHLQLISKILIGKVNATKRKEIVKLAAQNQLKFLFATDKLLEKGFDEELLSILHIVFPVADPNKVKQLCGRVTRVPNTKEIKEMKKSAKIFYYFDFKEEVLRGAASTVAKTFTKLKIKKRVIKCFE